MNMITFEHIKAQKKLMAKYYVEREEQLRSDVSGLLRHLIKSLDVPSDMPTDGNGKSLPFVYIGVINSSGLMQHVTSDQLKINKDYELEFYFCFLTDEHAAGGSYCNVPIVMSYDSGFLYIISGRNQDEVRISAEKTTGEVLSAVNSIKQSCLDQLIDVRLL